MLNANIYLDGAPARSGFPRPDIENAVWQQFQVVKCCMLLSGLFGLFGLLVCAAGIIDIVVKLVRNFLKGTKAVAKRRKCDSSKFSSQHRGKLSGWEAGNGEHRKAICVIIPRLVRFFQHLVSKRASDPKCNLPNKD